MFKKSINFKELVSSGTTFEVTPPTFEESEQEQTNEDGVVISKEEYDEELLKHVNLNCIGDFEDENTYDSSEPFAALEAKMTNIFEGKFEGKLKKRVLREGYGHHPEENCIARVHYNAYTEFSETPFDCTYARKRPHSLTVGKGDVIPGLDIAVRSMKINECSQFLIGPELAYGKMGCLDRILPNSTVLFQIELLEIIESGAAVTFEHLPQERKADFKEAYKYAMSHLAKGKDLFNRNISASIRSYNMAITALENAQLVDYDEQVKQQLLLHKLLSNLVVCYTKTQEPKKSCIAFNKMRDMCKGTDLKISAKAYYNNARCLRMLGDFEMAKSRLQMARNLEPRNPAILNEFKIIDEAQQKYKEKDKLMASALVGGSGK